MRIAAVEPTLRFGSLNGAVPWWRGAVRFAGKPLYVCTHVGHSTAQKAGECARQALMTIKENRMPPGWETYGPPSILLQETS